MKKKIVQSFITVFIVGLVIMGGIFLFSEKTEIASEEVKKTDSKKELLSNSQSINISSTSEEKIDSPKQYIFDRTLFYEEDVTMTIESLKKDELSYGTYTFWMLLTSNVFTDINHGQTTSDEYLISSDNVKVVTDSGITLTGEELDVGAADGRQTIISSRDLDDEDGSEETFLSYTFDAYDINEIQVFLIDDEGNEMIASEWIESNKKKPQVTESSEENIQKDDGLIHINDLGDEVVTRGNLSLEEYIEKYEAQSWYTRYEDPNFTWNEAIAIITDVVGPEDSTFIYNGRLETKIDQLGRLYYGIWKEDPNASNTADGTIAYYTVYEDGTVEKSE